jgi:exportin-5
MYDRLTERWKYLATLRESPSFDEDNTDSKEVLDDVVCRHLAREYLDVVKAILTSGGGSDIAVSAFGNSENGENQSDNAATVSKSNGHGAPQLSELGALVLQHEALGQGVIMTLVEAVQWPDSLSSIRASNLLELVLPPLVRNGRLGDADAQRIYYSILRAIHELGRHEGNYIALMQLAIMAYETMRPKYPVIADVLAQVPGCNQEDLKRFDQRIMQAHAQGLNPASSAKSGEKAKKDMFKKLIAQFIVKDVSNLFKHDVVIKNLPCLQLLKPPRQKTPSVDETEKSDIGIGALFGSATATANGR